jgi:hypothetical protein
MASYAHRNLVFGGTRIALGVCGSRYLSYARQHEKSKYFFHDSWVVNSTPKRRPQNSGKTK